MEQPPSAAHDRRMDATLVRPRRRRQPGSPLAHLVVLVEVVLLVAGVLVVAASRPGSSGPGGIPPTIDPTRSPILTPGLPTQPVGTPTPSPIATPSPTPAPTATPDPTVRPTPKPTLRPTRAPTAKPTPRPVPTADPNGPPTCVYTDVLTPHHHYADWRISLLDTIYHLPSEYAPNDLEVTSAAGLSNGYQVRRHVIADLRAMADAARAAGAPIQVASAYRSYERQVATFQHWVNLVGYEDALKASARAGHSEHQLGTTLDFTSLGGLPPWEYADWATTPAGSWMRANAWRFGFVMSYPKGAFAKTCYQYEPWHYRYVGRELAAVIRESGATPREVLWDLQ
jgi:zinc D-Ala-D-Ala carboxypeptidase